MSGSNRETSGLPSGATEDPPSRVVDDARQAFHEAVSAAPRVPPIFDSWEQESPHAGDGATRTLVFSGPGLALMLTCVQVPGGYRISGAVFGRPVAVSLVVDRPARSRVRLPLMVDDRVKPTMVPRGPVTIVAEYDCDGVTEHWESDWLRL
jgi:hypothetical protein